MNNNELLSRLKRFQELYDLHANTSEYFLDIIISKFAFEDEKKGLNYVVNMLRLCDNREVVANKYLVPMGAVAIFCNKEENCASMVSARKELLQLEILRLKKLIKNNE